MRKRFWAQATRSSDRPYRESAPKWGLRSVFAHEQMFMRPGHDYLDDIVKLPVPHVHGNEYVPGDQRAQALRADSLLMDGDR